MLKKYYEQYDCIGVLAPRSYYVPFLSDPKNKQREQSEQFTLLNGEWKIREYKTVYDVPEEFYLDSPQSSIEVPSCLQMKGYDSNQYTNSNYPIPFNPPYVTNENPAYHYSKVVSICKDGQKKYLNFEGVDSCFYLYVNNKFVGFSQISHRVSEFDITDFILDGENKLDVLVLKWCAGTYLEDQDKWRFTGIFRDVYLLSRPVGHIVDYHISADMNGVLLFTLKKGEEANVTFGKRTVSVKQGQTVKFVKNNPKLWSAEAPNLYDLRISSKGEQILERVGFRTVEMHDKAAYFNGKIIKLLGVNRHDSHPQKGMTVNREDILRDLVLMKKLNINCIRTSHYPSCPEFYQMCDEMGFYVISESDLEGHGSSSKKPHAIGWIEYDEIAKRGEFYMPCAQRQECNILVNFNRPSIIMWSLGNETGFDLVLDRVLRFMRSLDNSRLLHYERVSNKMGSDRELYHTDAVDMANRMYPDFDRIQSEYFEDKDEFRPYFLCEYAHCMGNGPGGMFEYVDFFYSRDCLMGGCLWEWADHGLVQDGCKSYRYGGDFGETLHDYNFCIDGLVTADRECKPGTYEVKRAYQPLVFEIKDGKLIVSSRNYFTTVTGKLRLCYKNKGVEVKTDFVNIAVEPQSSIALDIDEYQTLIVTLIKNREEVAFETFNTPVSFATELKAGAEIEEKTRYYEVKAGDTTFMFDKVGGEISDIIKDGKSFGAMRLNVYRAPTDNDRNIKKLWATYYLDRVRSEARSIKVDGNVITVEGDMSSEVSIPVMHYTMRYEFNENAVTATINYEISPYHEQIPRIGFVMKEDKSFKNIEFYGYRAGSYCDLYHFSEKDVIKESVKDSYFHYVKPQENGAHYDCQYAEISSANHAIRAEGDGFSFNAIPYSDKELATKKHDDELISDGTHIHFDFIQQGIGTNSCGPEVRKDKRLPKKASKTMTIIIK